MDRRQYLATTGAGLTATLAGCTIAGAPIAGTTTLPQSGTAGRDDETYLRFARDGDDVVTVGLLARAAPDDVDRLPFRMHVSHDDGLHVERLRYRFHLPWNAGEAAPGLYYDRPDNGRWPPVTFQRDPDDLGETLFEMRDVGPVGEGSLTLGFLADVTGDRTTAPLTVDALVDLSGRGFGRYRAQGTLELTLGVAEDND